LNHPRCLLEVIVISPDDAVAAAAGGADRFEVCSALALGGLTPSLGTIRTIRAVTQVPVMAMLRPREGGMAYTDGELRSMRADAEVLIEEGVEGVVFGFLTPEGDVDQKRVRELLDVVRRASAGRPVQSVFHRAFDVAARPEKALEQLVDLGVSRILTSGRKPAALQGADAIRRYIEQARGRIEILPAAGIQPENVVTLLSSTGADQVHLFSSRVATDRSASANPEIRFSGHAPADELEYRAVAREDILRIRRILDSIGNSGR